MPSHATWQGARSNARRCSKYPSTSKTITTRRGICGYDFDAVPLRWATMQSNHAIPSSTLARIKAGGCCLQRRAAFASSPLNRPRQCTSIKAERLSQRVWPGAARHPPRGRIQHYGLGGGLFARGPRRQCGAHTRVRSPHLQHDGSDAHAHATFGRILWRCGREAVVVRSLY